VRVIALYRNHGQHTALMCGFQYCTGDYVVTIDDDLQHAPEDIPVLHAKLQEGHDAVFGCFRQKAHRPLQNLGSRFVARLNRRILRPPQALRLSSFRIIRRPVVEHFRSLNTVYPYVSAMILSTTHRVANAAVRHEPRRHGRSGYTTRSLIRLSYNLLVNYSAIPLKVIGYIGLFTSLVAVTAGITFVARELILHRAPTGWTSLAVLLSVFFGLVFAMLFVMAEYLSRLLTEVSNRLPPPIREVLT
jgi:glycosyltransferase involved in cell wall biosynthesis